jgi:hypothetical protein
VSALITYKILPSVGFNNRGIAEKKKKKIPLVILPLFIQKSKTIRSPLPEEDFRPSFRLTINVDASEKAARSSPLLDASPPTSGQKFTLFI